MVPPMLSLQMLLGFLPPLWLAYRRKLQRRESWLYSPVGRTSITFLGIGMYRLLTSPREWGGCSAPPRSSSFQPPRG